MIASLSLSTLADSVAGAFHSRWAQAIANLAAILVLVTALLDRIPGPFWVRLLVVAAAVVVLFGYWGPIRRRLHYRSAVISLVPTVSILIDSGVAETVERSILMPAVRLTERIGRVADVRAIIWHEDAGLLRARYAAGLDAAEKQQWALPLGGPVAALLSGAEFAAHDDLDALEGASASPDFAALRGYGLHSFVAFPVRDRKSPVAIFMFAHRERHAFGNIELSFARDLAALLSQLYSVSLALGNTP